jgi:membrane-bound lytic murein transglycosylase D
MKRFLIICFVFGSSLITPAQPDEYLSLEEMVQEADAWARENLDDEALAVLNAVDREQVRKVLLDLQSRFEAENVWDLAGLKEIAKPVIPLLKAYEETAPYADWLSAQLDYLEVADELKSQTPPPKSEPGKPPPPLPQPTTKAEREIWITKLSHQPWPPKAKEQVPRLKPLFEAQKIPGELVWIAEVESGFNEKARSPVGAVGMFQLMPATAKQLGLRTWPLDQRRDPEKSAVAAAQYLNSLHKRFQDWRLALAAYNAGEGRVSKLLKGPQARSYDDIASRLPAETQMYVPRIEAVLLKREGRKISELRKAG